VIRVNPDTGAPLVDNPLSFHADVNARRIVAYGMRNPFRIAVRPGTRELWVGDVGWQEYEELNVVPDPAAAVVPNFGWPCFDGTRRQPGYDAANLPICERLYASAGAVTFAEFQYRENSPVVAGETCSITDQSMSGLAFYQGGSYPAAFDGALFVGDFTRQCIWMIPPDADGRPAPSRISVFAANASFPVDLKIGPGGDLFYVDVWTGSLHRIQYSGSAPPDAEIAVSRDSGSTPLLVNFDGTGSSDPDGGAVTYAWDLDGDGSFDDSASPAPSYTYGTSGTYVVRLRVTDDEGLTDTASVSITAGNTRPVAVIDSPAASIRWRAGQAVSFSGHATDPEQGTLPAGALAWSLLLNHCSSPTSCHQHPVQEYAGVAGGAFTGPDHEYPSFLTLRLTATDPGGLTHTVERRLDPEAVVVSFATSPIGLQVVLGGVAFAALPANRTVIAGSHLSLGAPSPQTVGGVPYAFVSWSDGLPATHLITADAARTYTATFAPVSSGLLPSPWTSADVGAVGRAGSATYSGGVFTLTGAGADVWGAADAFRYAYRTLSGDGQIVARVAAVAGSQAWTKVGVMMRSSLDPGAAHAFMLVSTGKGAAFQRRTVAGALSTHTFGGAVVAPQWVRLVRSGSTITASLSPDGQAWTTIGSDTFSIGSSILVGLAVSSHSTSSAATGSFDRVSATAAAGGLPSGTSTADIGPVGVTGSATESGGVFTVRGAGADIWGTADAFRFVYVPMSADGQIVARVAAMTGTEAWAKAGVMIRESLTPGSAHAFMLVSAGKGSAFQRRPSAGAVSLHTSGGAASPPGWVRLVRRGSVITASRSSDGVTWTAVGSQTFSMGSAAYMGLAVSSHDAAALATATFDRITVEP
jgi:PKD repeat protein